MKPADLLAWFEELDARSLGAPVDEGFTYNCYPADLSLQWVADAESALQQVFPERHPIRKQWGERLAGTRGNGWDVRRASMIDALRAIFRSATGQLKAGRVGHPTR